MVTPAESKSSSSTSCQSGDSSSNLDNGGEQPRHFKFPEHQNHMLTLARMCQESKAFADCVIQCDGGQDADGPMRAHRLVLGSASRFLKLVFEEVPSSLAEATIVVPGVRRKVVEALLDFLYTGEMSVERDDVADLQLLIETLQIDPSLITVNAATADSEEGSNTGEEENNPSSKSSEVKAETEANDRKRKLKFDEKGEEESVKKLRANSSD